MLRNDCCRTNSSLYGLITSIVMEQADGDRLHPLLNEVGAEGRHPLAHQHGDELPYPVLERQHQGNF
jgi:hypothetical protein